MCNWWAILGADGQNAPTGYMQEYPGGFSLKYMGYQCAYLVYKSMSLVIEKRRV